MAWSWSPPLLDFCVLPKVTNWKGRVEEKFILDFWIQKSIWSISAWFHAEQKIYMWMGINIESHRAFMIKVRLFAQIPAKWISQQGDHYLKNETKIFSKLFSSQQLTGQECYWVRPYIILEEGWGWYTTLLRPYNPTCKGNQAKMNY